MSKIFRLNGHDLLKGLVVAVLSAVIAFLSSLIQNQGLNFSKENLIAIAGVAMVSALGYLSKQLITDEDGKMMGKL